MNIFYTYRALNRTNNTQKRILKWQKESLLAFMEVQHPELVFRKFSVTFKYSHYVALWEKIKGKLDRIGAMKSVEEWKKVSYVFEAVRIRIVRGDQKVLPI